MARPKIPATEKVVTIPASVKPSLQEIIKVLAQQRRWSPSKAAGMLIEKGLLSEGIEVPQETYDFELVR